MMRRNCGGFYTCCTCTLWDDEHRDRHRALHIALACARPRGAQLATMPGSRFSSSVIDLFASMHQTMDWIVETLDWPKPRETLQIVLRYKSVRTWSHARQWRRLSRPPR